MDQSALFAVSLLLLTFVLLMSLGAEPHRIRLRRPLDDVDSFFDAETLS